MGITIILGINYNKKTRYGSYFARIDYNNRIDEYFDEKIEGNTKSYITLKALVDIVKNLPFGSNVEVHTSEYIPLKEIVDLSTGKAFQYRVNSSRNRTLKECLRYNLSRKDLTFRVINTRKYNSFTSLLLNEFTYA